MSTKERKRRSTNRKQLQVTNGIDAVIVDSVLAIRKGLTEAAPSNFDAPLNMAQASSSQTVI